MTESLSPCRIALVSSYAPSLTRFRLDLIRAFIAEGHSVIAYAPENDQSVAETLAKVGCRFEVLPMARTGTNPFADILLLLRTLRAFRAQRPDVVVTYTMKPVIYGGIAARILGIRERYALMTGLGHVFSEDHPRGRKRVIRDISVRLYRTALKGARCVFPYNAADEADIRAFSMIEAPTRLVRVPGTGINLDRFRQTPIHDGPPRFLLIARLLADKGVREYVEAARLVKADWPDAEFQIVGPIDANPSSIQPSEIKAWQRSGIVSYLGETDDVRPFLDAASVFVLPSYYREGVPRSILEAMARGRPVITSTRPGCADTIEHGTSGYLVAPKDAKALADAMRIFLENPGRVAYMGAKARERAEKVFDIHSVNALLLNEMGLVRPEQHVSSDVA